MADDQFLLFILKTGGQRLMLIDTHAHLDDARFDGDRDAMIARAREAGVDTFVTIGCDLDTSRAAVELADRYPFVYAAVGVHPH
ncbi:MAG: TatD family hydrolase, partial [Nitrospirota bacterium]